MAERSTNTEVIFPSDSERGLFLHVHVSSNLLMCTQDLYDDVGLCAPGCSCHKLSINAEFNIVARRSNNRIPAEFIHSFIPSLINMHRRPLTS